MLLRKSFQDAEQFERRLFAFGSPNEVVRVDPTGPEGGEEQGKSGESRNPNHIIGNQEDSPEVLIPGGDFDGNTSAAVHVEAVPTNAQNITADPSEEETRYQGDLEKTENNKTGEHIADRSSLDDILTDKISPMNGLSKSELSAELTVEPEYEETAL